MAEFSNAPIDVNDLPRLDHSSFVSLHPNYLKVSLIGTAIGAVVVVVGAAVLGAITSEPLIAAIIAGAILALSALGAVLKVFEVRHIAYQIREHDISYRSGVLSRQVQTVPFVRVQHARMNRGMVERAFGLATLAVNSAGPDLRIPGLAVADAEAIQALVIERAGALHEEQQEERQ